jgi:Leucine-rich repeat (LRR) protein
VSRRCRLPPLRAPTNNAAMEAEPTKAEPPKRKRRWFTLTRERFLLGLLAVEILILSASTLRWFSFDVNPVRTALIAFGLIAVPLMVDPLLRPALVWLAHRSRRLQFSLRALMCKLPKRKRRWFQFSLRTLFVFILICAVAASWLGRKIERKREEQVAVTAIAESGSIVRYDGSKFEPTGPKWLRRLLGNGFFSEVSGIEFHKATDAQLEYLDALPQLQYLTLTGNDITDAGLIHLKGLTQLRSLFLEKTKITDAGLAELQDLPHLEALYLWKTKVTDAGLERLKELTGLMDLQLDSCNVTDAGLKNIKGLLRLGRLSLSETLVTDHGLAYLKGLKQLRLLKLINNTSVTDAGVADLQNALPYLEVEFGSNANNQVKISPPRKW